ncbi:4-hydroxy-tetrahydrodipicolinate synthase family protein [Nitratireductor indicus]|uniref:4-hydroxy-tetrahydrodipicolinate synthase n=1 Tax=Nitratireductor indicus C115 TaxID=1231190 RepID=K2N243_9HYPH|nr:4-hydroxy-tetrahydrodipicolinate synthase [Nitratireductor indicus]EKF41523.1 dihydrodipicolinate synthetase [Nitratireductor indicus C115]MDS1136051.1 4-hydroxy-tetrahydrodipicolinate synthase [Nitratireductor indicus]SFQ69732.1 4-hydroxy-tetrahydrodipicolinate synthase [Nitratireductor indicus]
MTKMRIEGSFVAMITPFNQDGTVDFAAFEELLKFQRDNGTSAVFLLGSTSEISMLSLEERREIITRTARMKSGGMKHFYGCTGGDTASTIEMLHYAKAEGADGAILSAPAYICASEADIEAYFLEAADSIELPMGIYNNPPRVKTDLGHEALLRLFKHPNYVVHKESTTRVGQVGQILAAEPDVSVMCCDSPNLGLVVPTMTLGGHGTANMTGNIAPAEIAALSKPWKEDSDGMEFRRNYLRLLPLLHYTYSATNPVAVKSLMRAIGLPSGDLRRPLTALQGPALERGVEIVRRLGLLEKYNLPGMPLGMAAE